MGKTEKQKKNKQKVEEDDGGDKSYFRWTLQMERELANILRDERNLGNKGDGGWKATAYNSAAAILSAQFATVVTSDNVKNRVKLWKKYYGIVSDILGQSGFNWDGSKQMITVDDEAAWNDYVKSHENAKSFRWKVITNWDDMVDLCGKDRATGEGAETAFDADDVTIIDNSNEDDLVSGDGVTNGGGSNPSSKVENSQLKKRQSSPTSGSSPQKKKVVAEKKRGGEKIVVAQTMDRMVTFLEGYLRLKENALDVDEVVEVVEAISDLDEDTTYRACNWLAEDGKKFRILKKLRDDKRKDYILKFMPQDA